MDDIVSCYLLNKMYKKYEIRNEEAPIDQKIFNIKVFKKQLESQKQQVIKEIEKCNFLLNPSNYLEEKNKLIDKKEELEVARKTQKQLEKH